MSRFGSPPAPCGRRSVRTVAAASTIAIVTTREGKATLVAAPAIASGAAPIVSYKTASVLSRPVRA